MHNLLLSRFTPKQTHRPEICNDCLNVVGNAPAVKVRGVRQAKAIGSRIAMERLALIDVRTRSGVIVADA
jgi:hypothetical protein